MQRVCDSSEHTQQFDICVPRSCLCSDRCMTRSFEQLFSLWALSVVCRSLIIISLFPCGPQLHVAICCALHTFGSFWDCSFLSLCFNVGSWHPQSKSPTARDPAEELTCPTLALQIMNDHSRTTRRPCDTANNRATATAPAAAALGSAWRSLAATVRRQQDVRRVTTTIKRRFLQVHR